ncbi:MAG: hypothetical protein SFV55_21265 [Haliscomenobacter sp.]|uniref:hypothetical protein n=1 Tax=Haliscomenobacter sp. TaxID=2717303 RepID=UPI0029BB9802|nr:hypothetical protein [Haliscomenobacter sp.]MDX2070973.1 hypothetical protein [Haliscomenobacter sp.]
MEIVLTNAEEAGMPEEMIGHCMQLLTWRIEKLYPGLPKAGDDLDILYSEKDPLMESEEVDDEAYAIYFTVAEVQGEDRENGVVMVDLIF